MMPSSCLAASTCLLGYRWLYVSIVVCTFSCPSRSAISSGKKPISTSRLAWLCRMSCTRIRFTPDLHRRIQIRNRNRRRRAVYPFGGHARRRAQPRHVRRAGTRRVPLSSSCDLYPHRGETNPVVETLQG